MVWRGHLAPTHGHELANPKTERSAPSRFHRPGAWSERVASILLLPSPGLPALDVLCRHDMIDIVDVADGKDEIGLDFFVGDLVATRYRLTR
jgi:hypothetical protein